MKWIWTVLLVLALAGCTGHGYGSERIEDVSVTALAVHSSTVLLDVNVTVESGYTGEGWSIRVRAVDEATGLLAASATKPLDAVDDAKAVSVALSVEVPRKASSRLMVDVLDKGILVDQWYLQVRQLNLLPPDVEDIGVLVDHLDLNARGVANGRVDIDAALYLVNERTTASEAIMAQVVVREVTTRLVVDEQWVEVPSIVGGGTAIGRISLDLPDSQAYMIESTLWSESFVVGRASEALEFGKNGSAVARSVDLIYERDPDAESGQSPEFSRDSEDSANSAPGAPLLGLVAVLGAAALIYKRVQS